MHLQSYHCNRIELYSKKISLVERIADASISYTLSPAARHIYSFYFTLLRMPSKINNLLEKVHDLYGRVTYQNAHYIIFYRKLKSASTSFGDNKKLKRNVYPKFSIIN